MKSSVKMLVMATVIAALTCAGSMAQGHGMLKANIPFDFMVGDERMPAGEYTITRGVYPIVMQICASDNDKCLHALYHPASKPRPDNPNALVFNSFGNKHFLREIWSDTGFFSAEFSKPRAEKGEAVRSAVRTVVAASPQR